ncbi:CapA family protein [Thermomicrobium sp. 4228-Ro]|uniref:CapA family protein n=1 Tax=Thermomicrobium sp. 4228-Ro TaxID=2993937 RepID=UPI002248F272|nr:CapA family protein [Thermomicrobium sp. 4228-Ro]MCX2725961.1 CapA family protein [Thermomicrobium sp. 4228-Ro]
MTSHDNLVQDLPVAALPAILDGTIDDWQALGSVESLPIARVSVRDEGFVFSNPLAVVARVPELLTLAQPGVLAFVEPTAIHPRLSVLTLDSRDPLRQAHGAAIPEVLTEWLVVEGPVQLLPDEAQLPVTIDRPRFLTVTVVGDMILGRTVHRIMERLDDWQAPFRDVADELARSDLTIGNLECALSDRFPPPDDPYTMRFLTFPRAVDGLTLAGIDAVSLANNHSMDFGADALRDTQAALDRAGISWFGAGDDLRQASEPAVLRVGNVTIALLGFDGISAQWSGATETTAGTAPLEPEIVATAIRRAADCADIVIPYFHWGVEYTLIPTETQRRIAHLAIDSGATLVVGSHPHWVQGIEWYRGRPIFYSLGNFVFDQEWSFETKQGLILHLWFSGAELRRYHLVPVIIQDYHRPRLARSDEASVILRRVRESSQALS